MCPGGSLHRFPCYFLSSFLLFHACDPLSRSYFTLIRIAVLPPPPPPPMHPNFKKSLDIDWLAIAHRHCLHLHDNHSVASRRNQISLSDVQCVTLNTLIL